jgi:hypothetical protein
MIKANKRANTNERLWVIETSGTDRIEFLVYAEVLDEALTVADLYISKSHLDLEVMSIQHISYLD